MQIGTDIVYIPKIKETIEKYPHFIKSTYTESEINLANKSKNSLYFYADRFAAKEAIIKATNGKYDFKEIEVLKNNDGKPIVNILNNENINIELSLSYDNDYAIAFCIVLSQKK